MVTGREVTDDAAVAGRGDTTAAAGRGDTTAVAGRSEKEEAFDSPEALAGEPATAGIESTALDKSALAARTAAE